MAAVASPGRAAARRAGAAPDEEKTEQPSLEKALSVLQQEVDEMSGSGKTQAQSALKTLRSLVSGEGASANTPGRAFNNASSPGMRAAGK
jgi:hypothetical protein